MAAPRQRRGRKPREKSDYSSYVNWNPKTKLGRLVRDKQITTMIDALNSGLPLREPEIVDILVPDINDEVVDVNMVQRMTDSGRRVKFVISVAIGNNNGFIGFGQAKGKEVGSSIRSAIENAKLNIIAIRRGCGSWECGCRKPHTVPFAVKGKSGSVEIILKPASSLSTTISPACCSTLTGSSEIISPSNGFAFLLISTSPNRWERVDGKLSEICVSMDISRGG